jgi:AraC family transcriptional activator of mtrCDE
MDWLSRLLNIVPVTGRLELRCLYGAPWEVVYEPSPAGEMPYHIVLSGTAHIQGKGDAVPQELNAGDIVLLAHGSAHVLRDGSGAKPGRVRQRQNQSVVVTENSGRGERLDMLCGRFVIAPQHERLMKGYLPSTLIARGTSPDSAAAVTTHAQLSGLVDMMRTESMADSLGGQAMLNALSAALFTLTLRAAGESDEAPIGLLAAARHTRLAPALEAMLEDPGHPWSLPEIAALCNMSRATAARHFQERLGRSANDLLTDIRMSIAANELKEALVSTEAVAEKVGYQSINAFRLAFKQRMGMSPADWRRSASRQAE